MIKNILKKIAISLIDKYLKLRNMLCNKITNPTIVLMYHRVNDENIDESINTVSIKNFKDQIRFLKKTFNILHFDEDWSKSSTPNIVITFDDGYYDNYEIALKILKEEDVAATFFISTRNLDSEKLFWWDELAVHLETIKQYSKLSESQLHTILKNKSPNEQEMFFEQYRPYYKSVDSDTMEYYRFLNPEELYEFSKNSLVTIGAHTVNHPKLSILNREIIKRELQESKDRIEKIIKKEVSVFAYPFGGYMDYNRDVIEVCNEVGFKKAATTVEANSYLWDNPLKIPRHMVEDDTLAVFKHKIEKLLR